MAQKPRVTIIPVQARNPQEIDQAFARMVKEKAGALIIEPDSHFNQQVRQIVELTVKHRLPAIAGTREFFVPTRAAALERTRCTVQRGGRYRNFS